MLNAFKLWTGRDDVHAAVDDARGHETALRMGRRAVDKV
jgi:hypothetical protein